MPNLAAYVLNIYAPEQEPAQEAGYRWSPPAAFAGARSDTDKRVLANLPAMLEALEEDLTALLPDGYRAIVKEWDQ